MATTPQRIYFALRMDVVVDRIVVQDFEPLVDHDADYVGFVDAAGLS